MKNAEKMVAAGFAELEKRGFRVGASDLGRDDLIAVYKAMMAQNLGQPSAFLCSDMNGEGYLQFDQQTPADKALFLEADYGQVDGFWRPEVDRLKLENESLRKAAGQQAALNMKRDALIGEIRDLLDDVLTDGQLDGISEEDMVQMHKRLCEIPVPITDLEMCPECGEDYVGHEHFSDKGECVASKVPAAPAAAPDEDECIDGSHEFLPFRRNCSKCGDPYVEETSFREYVTKAGESLAGIAMRELGDERRWRAIRALNRSLIGREHITANDYFPVGTKIKLPSKQESAE